MNNRQRQIYKADYRRIRAEHSAMMKELFDFMNEAFAELYDEMEEKENEVCKEN